jgi:hypothetical protein
MTPTTTNMYPADLDFAWIAIDKNQHVGFFITAGEGPIPIEYLNAPTEVFESEIEKELSKLPQVCNATLIIDVPKPDSFLAPALRGIFVFDWADAGRSYSTATGMYECAAAPTKPVVVSDLPTALAIIAKRLFFSELSFSEAIKVDVCQFLRCQSALSA